MIPNIDLIGIQNQYVYGATMIPDSCIYEYFGYFNK